MINETKQQRKERLNNLKKEYEQVCLKLEELNQEAFRLEKEINRS